MKRFKLIIPFIFLVIIFISFSCSRPQEEPGDFLRPDMDEEMPASTPGMATGTTIGEVNLDDFDDESRMIVHNADMHLIGDREYLTSWPFETEGENDDKN